MTSALTCADSRQPQQLAVSAGFPDAGCQWRRQAGLRGGADPGPAAAALRHTALYGTLQRELTAQADCRHRGQKVSTDTLTLTLTRLMLTLTHRSLPSRQTAGSGIRSVRTHTLTPALTLTH